MLQNSLFDDKEIEKESRVIVDEMKDIEDSPEEIIFDEFESILFKGSSLELPIIGTEKNVLGATPTSPPSLLTCQLAAVLQLHEPPNPLGFERYKF